MTTRRQVLESVELAACLSACDALALTYELDAPSGFLVSAYQTGVPIIAAGSPWVTAVVRDRALGLVCDLTIDSVGNAMDALIQNVPEASQARDTLDFGAESFAAALLSRGGH